MPWPMVHFAVAQQVSNGTPSAELLIGSIAPDAIHMRPGTTRRDKKSTHLFHDGKYPSVEMLVQLCVEEMKRRDGSIGQREFVLGYFAHIFTDLRWVESFYMDFKREESQASGGDKEHMKRVYEGETSQLEFELMRSEAWMMEVLDKLKYSESFALASHVTADEVARYREAKLQWLLNPDNEPKYQLKYFALDRVRDFIVRTSQEWLALQLEIEQSLGERRDDDYEAIEVEAQGQPRVDVLAVQSSSAYRGNRRICGHECVPWE